MAIITIGVREDQAEVLRSLVEGALRESIEAIRQGSIERQRARPSVPEEAQAQGFFEDALGLLESDLVGLYRLFLVKVEEEPQGAPEEPSGETVEETD